MRRLPPLSALRAFEAAARHLSFKGAAGELAVTPTAISHQVKLLEDHLGVPLFHRRTRRVELTAAANTLYPVLRAGFDAFVGAIEQVAATQPRQVVRISATAAFTALWLLPRVQRFQVAHPDIDLQLHASDDVVSMGAAQIDLAVRYGHGPYPGLRVEVLLTDRFAPVASPRLALCTADDLRRVPLIYFDWRRPGSANPTWDVWFRAAGLPAVKPISHLLCSEESHAIQAAMAGQGAALLSLVLVRDALDAGGLVQPFGPVLGSYTYHLVEAADRPSNEATQIAKAWLIEEVRAEA